MYVNYYYCIVDCAPKNQTHKIASTQFLRIPYKSIDLFVKSHFDPKNILVDTSLKLTNKKKINPPPCVG